MSRYGRDSERQAFSFMDDVPVKISEKYKPPRKVTLPVSYQQRFSTENVIQGYDFKLEKNILDKMGEWRKVRREAVERRREKIKSQERASSKLEDSAVATTSQSSVSPVPPPYSSVEVTSSSYQNSTYPDPSTSSLTPDLNSVSYSNPGAPSYAILTPIPIVPSSADAATSKVSAHFNFSDFEADTSSPFDNMELKTINDMEELAHVLQPLSNPPNQIKQKPPDPEGVRNSYASYDVDQVALCNSFDSKLKKDPSIQPHINGLTGYGLYGTGSRIKQGARTDGFIPYDYTLHGMPLKSDNTYDYYPDHRTWAAGMNAGHLNAGYPLDPTNGSNVTSETSAVVQQPPMAIHHHHHHQQQPVMVERPGYETVHHPPLTYGASFPSTCNSNQDQHSPGRSLSKSVPDIVQELEKELKNKQAEDSIAAAGRSSHTPPPRPNSFGSTGLENWKPWPDLDSPPRGKTPSPSSFQRPSTSKVPPRPVVPNPFWSLNPRAQKLVTHISEMGFSLPRVARACQLLGEDDKRIVEFLLQVQCLEEKKYPGERAEKALIVNRYNMDHAVKYLDALSQLLDLGFPEDQVSDALVMFNNDRDKALDKLIS